MTRVGGYVLICVGVIIGRGHGLDYQSILVVGVVFGVGGALLQRKL